MVFWGIENGKLRNALSVASRGSKRTRQNRAPDASNSTSDLQIVNSKDHQINKYLG